MKNFKNKLIEKKINKMIKDNKDMNNLLEWHEKYKGEVYCPFCGVPSGQVRTNGDGFYRCMGECKNRFFLLRCTEERCEE